MGKAGFVPAFLLALSAVLLPAAAKTIFDTFSSRSLATNR
jgi:hypothetical protein